MRVDPLPGFPEVLVVQPDVYSDHRGHFLETHHRKRYADHGIDVDFVQDNHSFSVRGVLRGLHFQNPQSQGKLVWVVQGEVFDIAVDIRIGSPTFGSGAGRRLSSDDHHQLYIPAGFAHGFVVTSDAAHVVYKCSAFYDPANDHTLLWRDPSLGIEWPVAEPIVSSKDAAGRTLDELHECGILPRYVR